MSGRGGNQPIPPGTLESLRFLFLDAYTAGLSGPILERFKLDRGSRQTDLLFFTGPEFASVSSFEMTAPFRLILDFQRRGAVPGAAPPGAGTPVPSAGEAAPRPGPGDEPPGAEPEAETVPVPARPPARRGPFCWKTTSSKSSTARSNTRSAPATVWRSRCGKATPRCARNCWYGRMGGSPSDWWKTWRSTAARPANWMGF